MNKKITVGLFCTMMTSLFCNVSAQTYQPLNVTGGYNADLVANGSGTAASSTSASVDSPNNGYVFMSAGFVNGSGVTPAAGLPNNGLINSANTSGLNYQLASYSGNNSLRLDGSNSSGTLNFSAVPSASTLYMLATSGSGISVADITVNFTDGTSQTFTNNNVNDWYGGSSYAILGIGRASRVTDAVENNTSNPRLYEVALSIAPANQIKTISNITVSRNSSSSGILCVFGFSCKVYNGCVTPDNISASNITSSTATVSWSQGIGGTTYEMYKSTSSIPPTVSTTPTLTGITGTSTNITALSPVTTYYIWMRTNCGNGNVSDWSPVSFTTSCTAYNAPYTQDFDSATIPDLPMCTSSQTINTSGSPWAVTDGTGILGFSSNIAYIITFGNDTDAWFYTGGVNLQAGTTYNLAFDYANYDTPQSMKVAYGTSPLNTAMTNVINDYATINLGTSTPATFTVTPTASGVYYFGFECYTSQGNGDFGSLILDNIKVTTSTLSTAENLLSKNNVSIYPNPTSDYLNIKSAQNISGIKIFDASGKMVSSFSKTDRINVSELVKGTYFVTVKNADGTSSTHKFIKK